jgi:plastocyanin
MARRALAVAAAAGATALAAGAASGAAGQQPSRADARAGASPAPVARLRLKHSRVRVGHRVLLDASRSRDAGGHIVYYLWDLNGDGIYERNTGSRPRVRHIFRWARKLHVGVAVIDDSGAYSVRRARLRVVDRAQPAGSPAAGSAAPAHPGRGGVRAAKQRKRARTQRKAAAKTPTVPLKATVTPSTPAPLHAAASTTVTISDYKFTPPSITVNVGDTVTWTNNGPTGHSATANDGTFDTGVLNKASTGSYRFTKAGTFGYHCSPHPYMKATVIVKAASGGTSTPTSTSNTSNSSSTPSHSSSLPHTGLEIASVVLAGLLLLGAGVAIRRRLAGH